MIGRCPLGAHNIWFTGSPSANASWVRWVTPLRESWPSGDKPDIHHVAFDRVLAALEDLDVRESSSLPEAVVIVFGDDERPQTIDRVVEGLFARNLPALCLMPDPKDWKAFQRDGVLFERADADLRVLAAMVFALAERQGAVDLLAKEVYVTQRCHGGIRSEIDRLHDELHIAASVQREFLPSALPTLAGIDFGLVFRPVNYVSGDIYDLEQLDDDHVGFFIADAVGHGVPAALLTLMLRNNLCMIEPARPVGDPDRIIQPAEVMRRLNARLCHTKPGGGRFATAAYGVIESSTRKVTLAGAGHPHPLLMGGGLPSRAIETEGPLLGVFADGEFTQAEFTIEPGQTLLLYTDGLECAFPEANATTARDFKRASKRYMDHVTNLLCGETARAPEEIMRELERLLDEQAGSLHQADDVTAIAMAPKLDAAAAAMPRAKAA